MCRQNIEPGTCTEKLARWGFEESSHQCRPFYYSGCGGNQNNFLTREECHTTCPDAFPPELEIIQKIMNLEEGSEAILRINVSGNPYPSIFWQHSTEDVEYDDRIVLMADNSIKITSALMSDAGSWMVTANNDLGKVVRKQISVTVYPSSVPIKVSRPTISPLTNTECARLLFPSLSPSTRPGTRSPCPARPRVTPSQVSAG